MLDPLRVIADSHSVPSLSERLLLFFSASHFSGTSLETASSKNDAKECETYVLDEIIELLLPLLYFQAVVSTSEYHV